MFSPHHSVDDDDDGSFLNSTKHKTPLRFISLLMSFALKEESFFSISGGGGGEKILRIRDDDQIFESLFQHIDHLSLSLSPFNYNYY